MAEGNKRHGCLIFGWVEKRQMLSAEEQEAKYIFFGVKQCPSREESLTKLITLQRQNINFSRAFTQWKLIKMERRNPISGPLFVNKEKRV